MNFYWNDRIISGSSDYLSGRTHGSIILDKLRRGRYISSGAVFVISDAAGFFCIKKEAGSEGEITVKPSPVFESGLPEIMGSGGENLSRVIRKKRSEELTESRQYYPGDDLRRLNWKTFAHTGQLFIRLGEELPNPESHLLIITDLSGAGTSSLTPLQLGFYLDYIVDRLSGLIIKLEEGGINVDCMFPPEIAADTGRDDSLSQLWWSDNALPYGVLRSRKHSACLILCSAFSTQAGSLCAQSADAGIPVNVMVPLPSLGPVYKQVNEHATEHATGYATEHATGYATEHANAFEVKNLLRRFLFKDEDNPGFNYSEHLQASAEGLISGLKLVKGVASAEII